MGGLLPIIHRRRRPLELPEAAEPVVQRERSLFFELPVSPNAAGLEPAALRSEIGKPRAKDKPQTR